MLKPLFLSLCCIWLVPSYAVGSKGCNCSELGTWNQTCNPINGQCPCKILTKGLLCDVCVPGSFGLPTLPCQACPYGMYGDTCMMNCSDGCAQGCKDVIDDDCYGGCTTDMCENCTYNDGCLANCSQFCAGVGGCHVETGKCDNKCKKGYKGDNCTKVRQDSEEGTEMMHNMWYIAAVVAALTVIVPTIVHLITCLTTSTKAHPQQSQDGEAKKEKRKSHASKSRGADNESLGYSAYIASWFQSLQFWNRTPNEEDDDNRKKSWLDTMRSTVGSFMTTPRSPTNLPRVSIETQEIPE